MNTDPEKEKFREDLKDAGLVIVLTIFGLLAMCGLFCILFG
jgi:hypothetical protein